MMATACDDADAGVAATYDDMVSVERRLC